MIEIIRINAELVGTYNPDEDLTKIETMARTCYNSPMSETKEARDAFIRKLVQAGHESVIEHVSVSFMLTVPRSISHQIVRHRVGVAYSQQSQRYVDLSRGPLQVIAPVPALEGEAFVGCQSLAWKIVWKIAEVYNAMIASGVKPQVARSILPNCTATKLGMTANLRAWRHILKQRWTNPTADPAIREVMGMVGAKLKELYPPVFGDIVA